MKKPLFLLLTVLLLFSASGALAREAAANGTVVSTQTEIVSAQAGGTAGEIHVSVGDAVSAGDVLFTLKTGKVYAQQDGVARLFGQVGDDAAAVAERYGAVAYIEPDQRYSVSASTKYAYAQEENKIIHPGETVYLRAVETISHTGEGRVTAVSASGYTVEVVGGNLQSGEAVYIYRRADYSAASRIGRDSVALSAPIAYTAEGLIAAFNAADGQRVKKGDVLFETVEGAYSGRKDDLTRITSPGDGIVSSVSLSKGGAVSVGAAVAEIYLDEGMRVEASVAESDLLYFQVGNAVRIELNYLEDGNYTLSGVVEKVSRIGAENGGEDSGEAWFSVLIRPESTQKLAYGMHAVIIAEDTAQTR